MIEISKGILLPFLGTSLGSACVFLMKNQFSIKLKQILTGFAAGIMTAASVWSLLIPALEQSSVQLGRLAFLPAAGGFLLGIGFLLLLDQILPLENLNPDSRSNTMMMLAVTLHNIPEGMAVGVVYAGLLYGGAEITPAAAMVLALGIAIQNFPEGAIISMPLKADGMKKTKSFWMGVLSGAVEPAAAVLTIFAAGLVIPVMPALLSFAAGAMIYVVIKELIPEMSDENNSNTGVLSFSGGFAVMMILDVALG
ncbi:MAG: ZIP family metal transporter [Oscillospiraceae bacterium]|nr:ZIP family metal transporter [Oscillospiraceae bacterium]